MNGQTELQEITYIRNKLDDLLWSPFECFAYDSDKEETPLPVSWHYYTEMILVKEGTLKVLRGEKNHLLHAGEMIIIPSMMHHQLARGDEKGRLCFKIIRMDSEQLGELPSYGPDLRSVLLEARRRRCTMHLPVQVVRDYHLDQMLDRCVQEYHSRTYGYDLTIRAILYLITTNLVRFWMREGFIPQGPAAQIDPIYTVPSYIVHHIHEPLKVEELAKFCGLSYPWFARKFHQIYSISCKDFIEKVRIRKVEQYLLYTDCDLNYISEHSGYADCSHLVRDFRKFHNTTPTRYRRSYQQKARAMVQFDQNY